jgi:hypothetical protein
MGVTPQGWKGTKQIPSLEGTGFWPALALSASEGRKLNADGSVARPIVKMRKLRRRERKAVPVTALPVAMTMQPGTIIQVLRANLSILLDTVATR